MLSPDTDEADALKKDKMQCMKFYKSGTFRETVETNKNWKRKANENKDGDRQMKERKRRAIARRREKDGWGTKGKNVGIFCDECHPKCV